MKDPIACPRALTSQYSPVTLANCRNSGTRASCSVFTAGNTRIQVILVRDLAIRVAAYDLKLPRFGQR